MKSSCINQYRSYEDYPVYYGKDLELVYTPEKSDFALWSPVAKEVRLNLYKEGGGGVPLRRISMQLTDNGVWRVTVNGDQKGRFYTFSIRTKEGWLDETPGIWAKAIGINGDRAAIIDWKETHPEGWECDKAPGLKNFTDIIIYEMHYRDFSIAPNSGIIYKGKYLALTEENTFSPEGESTGIDHLKELGVTHIHLLPSYDFATIDETRLEDNHYNWGYDPKNHNAPDGSYSTDPYNPVTRIREMKKMIRSLHQNGFRVILDVVYNHTYSTEESNFNLTVPGYFYRQNPDGSYSNASGCGNETASERKMVRHFIVESFKFWAQEYHVDGFRVDLMGIHDIETMNTVRAALDKIDPTIFIYGEGWTAADSPLPIQERAVKENAPFLNRIAVFNDDLRDALKGSVFEKTQAGFVSGALLYEETVKFGIVGAIFHPQINYHQVAPYANDPSQVINYVSCHDDLCLVDKLRFSAPSNVSEEDLKSFNKLAKTIIFTSQGIPFMRAGEELYHDKKGDHNSYRSPDAINQIDWSFKTIHKDIFHYYKELIALRKAHPAFRIPTAEGVRKHLHFIDTNTFGIIAYTLSENANRDEWREILVIFNGNRHAVKFNIPQKDWTIVCCGGKIDSKGLGKIKGGKVSVEASSAFIVWN